MTPRRGVATALIVAALVVATLVGPGRDRPAVEAAPNSERVLLITDSVGLGTRGVLPDAFPAHWDVNIVGKPAAFVESLLSVHFRTTQALTPWMIGDHVVVAGGYNYPYWDPDRFDRSIDAMVDALTAAGVKHVHWVTLREVKPQFVSAAAWRGVQPYYWYFPRVNQHLRDALGRHPNLSLVDWAANADQRGLTYDAIHLNRTGASLFSNLIAQSVERASTRLADGEVVFVDVTDDPDATAAMVNLAAVFPRREGFLTAYPCDQDLPLAAQLVYRRDDVISAGSMVPVDDEGRVCVYQLSGTNLVVDTSGIFTTSAGVTDLPPNRIYDSRFDRGSRLTPGTHEVVVTDGTSTVTDPVALTISAVSPDRPGYVSAHPCDQEHETVTVNVITPFRNLSNMAVVEPDDDGKVCVTVAGANVHVVVDRTATFDAGDAASNSALEVVTPSRIIDTRDRPVRPVANEVIRFSLAEAGFDDTGVSAVGFNLAIVGPDGPGFATVWPCDEPRPLTSNINFARGEVLSNFVVGMADDDGNVCVSSIVGTNLTVDVLVGFGPGFEASLPRRALDTRLAS